MPEQMTINEHVSVGPQPSQDEIHQLSRDGFQSVVNFRTNSEDDQPLSPHEESEIVATAEMQYLHIPVSMDAMGPELVDQFRAALPELPKPVFAHCAKGKRAGAMVMMHVACEQGMSGEQALKQAEEMGFECDQAELRKFVKDYVDQNTQGG